MASVHDKLKKVRKPRVHITYDVETGDAKEKKELPFVAGVMGDFSGDNTENLKPLKERSFVDIDGENFNDVMEKTAPKLDLKVDNKLTDDGSTMAVNLSFNSMEDFEPASIIEQVEPLNKLMETRNLLNDLLSKADMSEDLEATLESILQDSEQLKLLSSELGVDLNSDSSDVEDDSDDELAKDDSDEEDK